MDGNGRWAQKKGLSRIEGHRKGTEAVINLLDTSLKLKIPFISLYAFSTENWRRPKIEITGLFNLLNEFITNELADMKKKGVKIMVSGDISKLPQKTKNLIIEAVDETKKQKNITANLCLNYGARDEIHRACETILSQKLEKISTLHIKKKIKISEKEFRNCLYTKNIPDVDLLIRTAGEKRLSNFLLYQCAYAEFYFTDVTWPDFNEEEFYNSIIDFQSRTRKYGGLA